jgi:predicted helicase
MEKSEHIQRTANGTTLNRQLEELACSMSCLAHKISDLTITTFANGTTFAIMQDLYESFKQELASDLTVPQFADLFAQTLSYGLFAAYFNYPDPPRFQRQHATSTTAYTNPLLQQLFAIIAHPEMDDELFILYVDELVGLLTEIDTQEALAGSYQRACQEDFLSCFYEKFLEHYDPRLRELRGVYYTPEPVVSYIVRSVDRVLRSYFNCQEGLADTHIILLDPACGTGIFLQAVIKHIRAEFRKTGHAHRWSDYVHAHLLPHLFGFELLMAPYVIAHLKLGMELAALDLPEPERRTWAYKFEKDERLNIYLANTLEKAETALYHGRGTPCLYPSSSNPVMIILGNPPYAGHSANKSQWINTLLDTYKADCPELKKPGQAKWLSDDYVKFIRLSQWHIEQAGYGILAFITNHSYLDNPTFRGLRRSLLQSFDDIYVLDLHGNRKKREQAPDGSTDENIFNIQQGVAISIFVKWRNVAGIQGGMKGGAYIVGARLAPALGSPVDALNAPAGAPNTPTLDEHATLHHAGLWGLREVYQPDTQGHAVLTGGKYSWLAQHDLATTHWMTLNPQPPFYLFAPQDSRYLAEYQAGWHLPDIFRPNGDPAPGIVTCHDQFAISWTKAEACNKVERFLSTQTEDEARRLFRLCSQEQWQYAGAKSELANGAWRQEVTEILYRPFDRRWTVFNRHVAVHRRERVMRHMLAGENIGLTIGRAGQVIDQHEWDIVFCTRFITEFNLYRRGGNNLFPLYASPLSPSPSKMERGKGGEAPGDRRANLAAGFITEFTARLGMTWVADGHGDLQRTFGPEDIFAYMYAVLYSPAYRKRYAPFLKIDFPRLPLTSNSALFCALCSLGVRLIGLHLMECYLSQITSFPVPGKNIVESVRYTAQSKQTAVGRVWINTRQYFDNVPLEAWNFSIGGYQICKKWLKDRKGRKLSNNELMHYQQIVAILTETTRLMNEIDKMIEHYGGWPI